MAWTVETVKAHCPFVQVKVGTKIYQGFVRGRTERFARVHLEYAPGAYHTEQVSWETVTRCLNAKRPILF